MNKEKREIRVCDIRAKDTDDGPMLEGYAAKFNKLSEDLGGFREKIKKGAFANSLKGSPDIRAFFDHDTKYILGRTPDTLTLEENSVGLLVQIKPPDTQLIRDLVLEPVRQGLINQMSFGFMTVDDKWVEEDDEITRTLKEVELFEVSVVAMPAYNDTSVAVRKLKAFSDGSNSDVLSPSDRGQGDGDTFVLLPEVAAEFDKGKQLFKWCGRNI